jgi:hypothetical protein
VLSDTRNVAARASSRPRNRDEERATMKIKSSYLKGNTSTPLAKTHAEELAKAVPGVQKVVDDVGTQK